MDNDFKRVKDALRIEDVIGEYLQLRPSGSNLKGVCPFHDDRRPSLLVRPSTQTYKCFVCGAGGDVITFVSEYEKLSLGEALDWCARRAGISLQRKKDPDEEKLSREREALQNAILAAADYYQSKLPLIQEYVKTRGYTPTDEVVKDFALGYSPDFNDLKNTLLAAGWSEQRLIDVGVLAVGKYGSYDVFNDRLIFPFIDLSGRVVGFSGRITKPRENTGKYINTSDTPLFKKGQQVYGLYQARRAIAKADRVYLVEGQMDVLSMHAAGIKNTVAGSGTALTPEQIQLIGRFTRNITLIYDSDDAGMKASLKNCEALLSAGFLVRCYRLDKGMDPDDLARQYQEATREQLQDKEKDLDFITYFHDVLSVDSTPETYDRTFNSLCTLISAIPQAHLQNKYIAIYSQILKQNSNLIENKVRKLSHKKPDPVPQDILKPGIYGLEALDDVLKSSEPCLLTSRFDDFLQHYGDSPVLLLNGVLSIEHVQQLRKTHNFFVVNESELAIEEGQENDFTKSVVLCFQSGITNIDVLSDESSVTFLNHFVVLYGRYFRSDSSPSDRTTYIQRCADVISDADESVRVINMDHYLAHLDLKKGQLTDILKPYLAKKKSKKAINSQRSDDDWEYDPDTLPDYVNNEPTYKEMYGQYKFFPKLNKSGEPVCYMFQNDKGGHTMVGDFFMTPLLHIQSDDDEQNKRVLKINRRFYKTPLYIEVNSKALLKKTNIEERLIMLEAVNFSNGEERHWTKIREWMSRNFITCSEVMIYGNQQRDGFSRREDENFFAFANGIFHTVDSLPVFTPSDNLGVVLHNNKNYYLPAFSTIYAGSGKQSERYETISTFVYKDIPPEKQCTFEHWASLMDQVYKLNNNGRWAILFAIMCAFRSNIHCLDRLFTAPFFIGPMSGGKTQIAISIRSLFINKDVPIFNLNYGTDAAMFSLVSTFRDVPVVLDEYNNKDISDVKFQGLKSFVYDGDGRPKRRATTGKEIENDKVYAPVVICGQEVPQRDDNALMSRVIICEVPKPSKPRTEEEISLFEELKGYENYQTCGLSNVLFEILKLRPMVMEHFRCLKQEAYNELKPILVSSGEIDRLMKTVALFLAVCKLIEKHSTLKLPFTYEEFFPIAVAKIKQQVDLISHSDKLATFFKAMDVMIDTKAIREGRDFYIDTPAKLVVKLQGGEKVEKALPLGTRVLFMRLSTIYTQFARSSYNSEDSTQSTIEQNLRSNQAFIGAISSRRFNWTEVTEVPRGGERVVSVDMTSMTSEKVEDTRVERVIEKKMLNSSCIAINYDIFRELYDIDLQRSNAEDDPSDTPRDNAEPRELTNLAPEEPDSILPF